MRDIQPKRPMKPQRPPQEFEPEAKELYKKQTAKLAGSKVPVANIQAPKKPAAPAAPPNVPKQASAPAQPRPLFANPAAKKPAPSGKALRRSSRLGSRERQVLAILLGLILITGALALLLFLPKADIELTLQTAPLLVDQDIVLAESTRGTGESTTIPANVFTEIVLVTGSVPVTSVEQVGSKATGQVEIVNRTTEEQSIKDQSRLVTEDGTLFYMQRGITVPPATDGVPARAPVAVEAAEPGAEGNFGPGRLIFAALDASAQTVLYAEATAAFTGGSGEEVKTVKQADLEKAEEAARTQARSMAEAEVEQRLETGMVILPESWDITFASFTPSAEEGDTIEEVQYTGEAQARVMAYEKEALQQTLKSSLEEQLDQNYMLFPGEVSFTGSDPDIQWEDRRATITARVTHTTIPTFSLTTLQEKLAGRSEAEAEEYLLGLPGVEAVSLDLWPFWAKSIPRIQQRINIELIPDRI